MNNQNSNMKEIEEKVELINHKIDTFQSKMKKVPSTVDKELTGVVNDLKDKKAVLVERLEHFRGAKNNAYRDLQTGVHMAWEDLNMAYESALERFEK